MHTTGQNRPRARCNSLVSRLDTQLRLDQLPAALLKDEMGTLRAVRLQRTASDSFGV
jgi:hypothetical protein